MKPSPMAVKVAKTFCRLLVRDLGPFLVVAIQLNRDEKDPGVCHTHDFCDANMVMDAAMYSVRRPFEKSRDEFTAIWNEAWDLAKKAEFDPEKIK